MADDTGTTTTDDTQTDDDTTGDTGTTTTDLGDAGARALTAERTARRTAERNAKAAKAELDKLRADGQSETEKAIAKAKADGGSEALAKANARVLKAEVRAAAASKLNDPSDATHFLDLSEFEVSDDGEVDAKAIAKAIDALLKDKPYLAKGEARRTTGSADGGARGTNGKAGPDMNAWLRGEPGVRL